MNTSEKKTGSYGKAGTSLDRREFMKAGASGALAMMCGASFAGTPGAAGTDLMTQYSEVIINAMRDIVKDERANILKAADLLSDNANEGRLLHVYGAGGHSAIAAMEIFWRAGDGLAEGRRLGARQIHGVGFAEAAR